MLLNLPVRITLVEKPNGKSPIINEKLASKI